MSLDIHYARNGDVSLAYAVMGDGPLDLLVIPGFVSHIEMLSRLPGFGEMIDRFGQFARMVSFDKRGTGLSDRGVGVPTADELAGDARVVMDAVGFDRVPIFGSSEGGSTSLLFAATFPERVSALVVYGGWARVTQAPDYPIGIPVEVLEMQAEMLLQNWGTAVGIELWSPSLADDPEARRRWAEFQRSAATPRDAHRMMSMYKALDIRSVLGSISAPTLVLHREGDMMVPSALGRYIAEHVPGARYVELPGNDHFPWAGDFEPIAGEVEEFLTGTRHAPPPSRKLATILFSDIVSSTKRAAEIGDRAWRDLIVKHDQAIDQTLDGFGGRRVKSTGDGVLATFEGPTAAVRCAHEIRKRLDALGLQIRAGVHTGEVEIIGNDIGGIGVVIARRVADLAHDGEVWVSGTVPGLAVGSGIEFDDRGHHTLKGVPGEWKLHASTAG